MKKLSLDDAIEIARKKNGKCLSTQYINNSTPLYWQCNKFHTWHTTLSNVKNHNTWCLTCSRIISSIKQAYTLEEVKCVAYSRNGECLSEKYYNNRIPLRWKCSKGHEWLALFYSIINNQSWCLLSNLDWRCTKGHNWSAPSHTILKECWCPFCSKYTRENLCRGIVTKLLGSPPSKNRRPDFLKTSKHPSGLELNIYYPQYGLAIEVQGEQHKRYVKHFHRILEGFNNLLIRD
ncbi:hypothetical protein Glove_158g12 [Diversispora epigaea]|uniref:Zinc-ribbon domain-containing protein n=1 Tax=Diversispora epigaea TaxID=1348612 RepID=A0A397IRQ7_9GLOM|nr:hypothetical protein Glove_158g12 [Diversispora epigaea]